MEIEVGDYIKTIYHNIEKVEKMIQEDGWVYVITNKSGYELECLKNIVVKKTSKDILDLIENEDILKVKTKDNEIIYVGVDENTIDLDYEEIKEELKSKEYQLLGILSHKQFEQNCYTVLEEIKRIDYTEIKEGK